MNIILYAGSLRPGGGLTVAKIMIEALAEDPNNNIVVYTGEKDASEVLRNTFSAYNNVQEKKFFPNVSAEIRYVLSKVYFIPISLLQRKLLLISVNYYIPVFCKQLVYHLNLLSFMRQEDDNFAKKIKEIDASFACRFATVNVFESDYLRKIAEKYTAVSIRNPQRLYIGIDPAFYVEKKSDDYLKNADILLVSSMQPHKDNQTCIDALTMLYESDDSVSWKLTIAGGQSIEQWNELKAYASKKGVADNIEFLGPVDKKRLSMLMNQSLCLISASKVESFCMVALEAMASKCPAVVTNDTSMPESVGNAAMIIESGSSKQFAVAISRLYHEPETRIKLVEFGCMRAQKFSIKEFNYRLTKIITNNFS